MIPQIIIKNVLHFFCLPYIKKIYKPTNINNKSKLSNFSANLVQAYSKDIKYVVNRINRGEKLRETPIDLNIKNKFIVYYYELPYETLDESSYIDLNKMKRVSSLVDISEYKLLINKSYETC